MTKKLDLSISIKELRWLKPYYSILESAEITTLEDLIADILTGGSKIRRKHGIGLTTVHKIGRAIVDNLF